MSSPRSQEAEGASVGSDSPYLDGERPVGLLLSQLATVYEKAFLRGLASDGSTDAVTSADHAILRSVAHGSATATEIAHELGVSKQAIGKTVGSLERRGYVERRRSEEDHRAQMVSMTDEGRRLVARSVRVARSLDARTRDVLGDEDLALLRSLLIRIHDAAEHVATP